MATVEEIIAADRALDYDRGFPDESLNPDVPLLRKLVEWVEEQDKLPPEQKEWNQGEWIDRFAVCGTAYCSAGYIGQMLDERYKLNPYVMGIHVSRFAAINLGLNSRQASCLFNGANSAAAIRGIVTNIVRHCTGEEL
jgi:hypothetical protein